MKDPSRWPTRYVFLLALTIFGMSAVRPAAAAPLPGGTLDPLTIPKFVQPLVIPPVMPKSTASPAPAADYDIAIRQFKQQILPGGIWNTLNGRTDPFPATTVWSYGRAEDPAPDSSAIAGGGAGVAPAPNSSFNYPAFTVEATSNVPNTVRWINDLKDPVTGNYLPHLLPVDQTLHWANPPTANCVMMPPNRTDCETAIPTPYTGPVPMVTHVHGAHVQGHSDGYPEAWWLPAANNIPAGYSLQGGKYDQANRTNTVPGSAYYAYENSQPASTIWYHDHALGMTRLNVYAGPAGFWLIRGGNFGDTFVDNSATVAANDGVLPGPAPTLTGGDPNFNAAARASIREVPIAIQDRSFNADGSLFYPSSRTFFDGFTGPYIGGTAPSDISPIWNPEAFFNTIVVNGTTWPKYEVAPARYRLRLLNGCNSRTLNLSMFRITGPGADGIMGTADDVKGAEVPFYQIGAEQGFLPKVIRITTGFVTTLPGNGTVPAAVALPDPSQALLMMAAERADVIVDFTGLANGTRIRIFNTAPDAPFGGFPDIAADPDTTGQVMDFVVNTTLTKPADALTTPPTRLVLPVAPLPGAAAVTRKVSLNEMMSDSVCVEIDAVTGAIVGTLFSVAPGTPTFLAQCAAAVPTVPGNTTAPAAPRMAVVGTIATDPATGSLVPVPLRWGDALTEVPNLNATEIWEIYNTTVDSHPIHLHLVGFQVLDRQNFDPLTLAPVAGTLTTALPAEQGYKDTVVAYPGQITRIKAQFDIAGLYVWHCHIVEHEDNEMMRPMVVTTPVQTLALNASTLTQPLGSLSPVTFTAAATPTTTGYEYQFWVKDATTNLWTIAQPYSLDFRFKWTPPATPGQYGIQVDARQIGGLKEKQANLVFTVAPSVTLTANRPSPQLTNVPITFTATGPAATGYEYRFWLKTGTTWAVARNYTTTNTWTWTPTTAGTYGIQVDMRTVGATVSRQAQANLVYVINATAPTVTLAANPPSPQLTNTPITFTATGAGGSGSYQYRFWLKTGATWTVVQNYSATNTWTWTPTAAGFYGIQVDIRNVGNTSQRQNQANLSYTIRWPAPTVTLAANRTSPQPVNTPITFTATGAGGSGSYQYRFWVKTGATWAVVQNYSATNTFTWTPSATGFYGIQVDIRNAGSAAFREGQANASFTIN